MVLINQARISSCRWHGKPADPNYWDFISLWVINFNIISSMVIVFNIEFYVSDVAGELESVFKSWAKWVNFKKSPCIFTSLKVWLSVLKKRRVFFSVQKIVLIGKKWWSTFFPSENIDKVLSVSRSCFQPLPMDAGSTLLPLQTETLPSKGKGCA